MFFWPSAPCPSWVETRDASSHLPPAARPCVRRARDDDAWSVPRIEFGDPRRYHLGWPTNGISAPSVNDVRCIRSSPPKRFCASSKRRTATRQTATRRARAIDPPRRACSLPRGCFPPASFSPIQTAGDPSPVVRRQRRATFQSRVLRRRSSSAAREGARHRRPSRERRARRVRHECSHRSRCHRPAWADRSVGGP